MNGTYEAQFPLRLMHKDTHLVSLAGYDAGVALPLSNLTKDIFQTAVSAGLGDEDFTALFKHIVQE